MKTRSANSESSFTLFNLQLIELYGSTTAAGSRLGEQLPLVIAFPLDKERSQCTYKHTSQEQGRDLGDQVFSIIRTCVSV